MSNVSQPAAHPNGNDTPRPERRAPGLPQSVLDAAARVRQHYVPNPGRPE